MASTTLTKLRQMLYRRLKFLQLVPIRSLGTAPAGTFAVGSLTSTAYLQNSNLNVESYRGRFIFRPDVAAADRSREIADLTTATGVLTPAGSNWADTTGTAFEILDGIEPEDLFNLLLEASDQVMMTSTFPLTLVDDGDMSASATTSWTATNVTASKITTAGNSFLDNIRTLRTLLTSSGGYVQNATTLKVNAGDQIYVSVCSRADVGTSRFALYDVTNGAELSQTLTHTAERYTRMQYTYTVPAGCEEITPRLGGSANSDDIYWSWCIIYNLSDSMVPLPAAVDEEFKLRKVREATYSQAVGLGWNPFSRSWRHDWELRDEVYGVFEYSASNPSYLQFRNGEPRMAADFFIEERRPVSSFTTWTYDAAGEALTTACPPEVLVAYWAVLTCQTMLFKGDTREKQIQAAWQASYDKYQLETAVRPIETPTTLPRVIQYMSRI